MVSCSFFSKFWKNEANLLPILLISFSRFCQNDYLRFESLSINEGLSHSFVKTSCRDSQGFLWFGTRNSLNRYDGYTFKVYNISYENTNIISSNQITDIYKSKNGNLWIANGGRGFNFSNSQKDSFKRLRKNNEDRNSVASDFLNTIFEDHSGHVWIETDGKGIDVFSQRVILSNTILQIKNQY
jgi:ligand-binding sensor domain-containing protein